MLKNPKIIVGSVILVAVLIWLAFTAQEWGNNAIGYANLDEAAKTKKVCYVKATGSRKSPQKPMPISLHFT
jgi:hypothetical protein